jgi:outer membrane protein TolC
MKRNNRSIVFFFVYVCSIPLYGQYKLNYSNFINNVLANNPLAQSANNVSKIAKFQYNAMRGNYDPQIKGSHENKTFIGKNYYSIINAEVTQPIFTSQSIKLGYDYGIGNNINPELQTSVNGLPYFGMEASLLQGLLFDKRRANVLKAKYYVSYANSDRDAQLNELLFESSLSYFDWIYFVKQRSINSYFLSLAQQRFQGLEQLVNLGERPSVDTIEASLFIQSRMLEIQQSEIEIQKQTNQIASFNWESSNPSQLNIQFISDDSLESYYEMAKLKISQYLYIDSVSNPIIRKYTHYQEILDVDKRLKKEMIKPKLDVNYNLLSTNTSQFNPIFSTNNYKWGVNVSFPLFMRNSVNEYRVSKLVSYNNKLELSNKDNELKFKIEVIQKTISLLSEQILNAEKTVAYSQLLVDAEKQRFNIGESSLFLINSRESKWLEASLKLADYKLKFIKTMLQIIYLKGNMKYTFN